jgi:hypothetical protein
MFSENLDDFLSTAELAVSATLQGGATDGVSGFFDAAYLEALGMAGTNPVFECKASAIAAGDIGKTLTVAGVVYTIRNREPLDDGAFVRLQLSAP